MELIIDHVDSITVVTFPEPSLDANNIRIFKAAIRPVLEPGARIILDMSRLDSIDSSGLGAIISCLRRLAPSDGDLKVCGLSKPVLALFNLVRIHKILDIYTTREEAIQSFQP